MFRLSLHIYLCIFFFFLMLRPPPSSTLFPSPTLSRSEADHAPHPLGLHPGVGCHDARALPAEVEAAGHDRQHARHPQGFGGEERSERGEQRDRRDRKSTRLNSSHSQISYAVFCLKNKT